MKVNKITLLSILLIALTSCASRYKMIAPQNIDYVSVSKDKGVTLAYKYDLLHKKYAKKESKKGIKLVAVKLTNTTARDLTFGRDIKLLKDDGNELVIMDNDRVFKTLKQGVASYLFYLLLTPINFEVIKTNEYGMKEESNIVPVGLILGPTIAGGNMIAAGSANKKFKTELLEYNIHGTTIKSGETKYGLIGIRSDAYDALKVKVEDE